MAAYLVFRLYGPLCSWGEIAVGESRHTANHPSRSALLGLFGAALGIERADEERQQALSASWRFGIKLLTPGTLLRDYHTVQAPRKQAKIRHRTRRQEMLAPVINTLLSSREYRMDSLSIVAAEPTPECRWTLPAMQDALRRPRFQLYLGRKSCVPALPLAPKLVDTPDLRSALDIEQGSLMALGSRKPDKPWSAQTDRWARPAGARYFWEDGMVEEPDASGAGNAYTMHPRIEFVRHDQPLSRRRWQFAPRREWAHLAPENE